MIAWSVDRARVSSQHKFSRGVNFYSQLDAFFPRREGVGGVGEVSFFRRSGEFDLYHLATLQFDSIRWRCFPPPLRTYQTIRMN